MTVELHEVELVLGAKRDEVQLASKQLVELQAECIAKQKRLDVLLKQNKELKKKWMADTGKMALMSVSSKLGKG